MRVTELEVMENQKTFEKKITKITVKRKFQKQPKISLKEIIERNLRTKADFLWKLCEPRENGMIFFRVLKGKNLNVMPGGNTFQKGRQKTQGCRETHVEGMPLQQACI